MGLFSRFFMAQEVFIKKDHCGGGTTVDVSMVSTLPVPVVLKDRESVGLVELMERGYVDDETVHVNCEVCNKVMCVLN
jgi:hypothetical protein